MKLPIPVTNIFPDAPRSDETDWQRSLIAHLGLDEWIRLEFRGELDLIGPVAASLLRRHGLRFPFNLHFHEPMLEAASGGSLLTGVGGDEALEGATPLQRVLARRAWPRRRDLPRLGLAFTPPLLRRRLLRRRHPVELRWLTPVANLALSKATAGDRDRFYVPIRRSFTEWSRTRYLHEYIENQALLAAEWSVEVIHPLADPAVLSALARELSARPYPTRTLVVQNLFPGVLPDGVATRETKADFDEVFWHERSRAFASHIVEEDRLESALTRLGLETLVDPEGLRETWRSSDPHANSYLLFQAVWLSEQG
jgi:asparagine synthase (glutamine-hydrolysing)